MSADEMAREIGQGVVFWVAELEGRVVGVMGFQDKGDVALTYWSIPARQIETSVVLADSRWREVRAG